MIDQRVVRIWNNIICDINCCEMSVHIVRYIQVSVMYVIPNNQSIDFPKIPFIIRATVRLESEAFSNQCRNKFKR